MKNYSWLYLLSSIAITLGLAMYEMEDYCMRDEFTATCKDNEIILVEEARYGRMRSGRCISEQYGPSGCSSDVTTYLDGLCSGRHSCETDVRLLIDITSPCPKDFMSYLAAGYTCRKVATGNREECHRKNHVTLQEPEGNLASMITEETAYGSAGCPWKIQALPGQKLNLTLYDFNRPWTFHVQEEYVREDAMEGCPVSLVVEDGKEKKSIRLCDTGDRIRHLYVSESNEILLHFSIRNKGNKHHYYMVNYKAIACPDLQVPASAWMKRDGDNARVQCNTTGEVWYLTCRDGHWIGDLGNCSASATVDTGPPRATFPIGLLLAVVIGVVLGVVIGACLLGVVFLCRKGLKMRDREEGNSILHSRRPPPVTEILYTETEGGTRMITGTRSIQPRDPRDPRSPRSDYGCKRPSDVSTRSSLMEETRKVIPDFVQSVDESGRMNTCLRNHVYESPKFQGGPMGTTGIRPGGGPPVYHELDTENDHERCPRHIIDH